MSEIEFKNFKRIFEKKPKKKKTRSNLRSFLNQKRKMGQKNMNNNFGGDVLVVAPPQHKKNTPNQMGGL